MDSPSKSPFNYNTYLMLDAQKGELEFQVRYLYDKWINMDRADMKIKDNYSQSKILFDLESKLYDKYHPHPVENRNRMERRCKNLRKRIEERFLEEYPEKVRDTLEAHNLYLVSKSKLDALRVCVVAYHSGLTDI